MGVLTVLSPLSPLSPLGEHIPPIYARMETTETRRKIDPKEIEAFLRLLARILLRLLGEEASQQEARSKA